MRVIKKAVGQVRPTIHSATRIEHVHLHVSHREKEGVFYQQLIGFDLMVVSHALQAAFLSAGGYHHHIGLITWQGAGAPLLPRGWSISAS